ncbi:translation termination inhibitor protein itt1 [Ascosphaera atra]|nr:translation termination inhibitor protein itt1 [Ascosphaera atra]
MANAPSLEDDERSIEISSIAAIYPELVQDPSSPFKFSLEIPVFPVTPQKVVFRRLSADNSDQDTLQAPEDAQGPGLRAEQAHVMTYFPPLLLSIDLPDGYPSECAPNFTIETEPMWLPESRRKQLVEDGRQLWKDCGGSMVLFSYIDYLQQEAEQLFSLSDSPDQALALPIDLQAAMLDYDQKTKRYKFEHSTVECGVCLEPKKGRVCHKLSRCGHVFCIPCLQDFFTACIKEGDIASVRCLAAGCAKEYSNSSAQVGGTAKQRDPTLSPGELLQIPLEKDLVERYVALKRKNKLEADKRTVYCPREWCQGAARSKRHPKVKDLLADSVYLFQEEDGEDDEDALPLFDPKGPDDQLPPMADRVGICEDCGYAFCIVCRKGWHGEAALCSPQREAELSAAEKANQEYIKKFTSPCPTCASRAQKSMGCNHMICFKCGTHYCYLCSSWLDQQNPYKHFNNVQSSCHMRLWELEAGDIPGLEDDI